MKINSVLLSLLGCYQDLLPGSTKQLKTNITPAFGSGTDKSPPALSNFGFCQSISELSMMKHHGFQ